MKYGDQFQKQYTLLPVIHVRDEAQAIRNVSLALEYGDGCFLINHANSPEELLEIYERVRTEFPSAWIGVNCLGWTPSHVFLNVPKSVDGIWADNASINEDSEEQPRARENLEAGKRSQWGGLYFGGVAFKYQRPVQDYARVSKKAAPFMDVVCTSGPGTGEAPARQKIEVMKKALLEIDGPPLAIASGITPENVSSFGMADCFLVATGISEDFWNFSEEKIKKLADQLKLMEERTLNP